MIANAGLPSVLPSKMVRPMNRDRLVAWRSVQSTGSDGGQPCCIRRRGLTSVEALRALLDGSPGDHAPYLQKHHVDQQTQRGAALSIDGFSGRNGVLGCPVQRNLRLRRWMARIHGSQLLVRYIDQHAVTVRWHACRRRVDATMVQQPAGALKRLHPVLHNDKATLVLGTLDGGQEHRSVIRGKALDHRLQRQLGVRQVRVAGQDLGRTVVKHMQVTRGRPKPRTDDLRRARLAVMIEMRREMPAALVMLHVLPRP
jgi:uncharacterized protein YeaO (DUF488 family)